MSYPSCPVFKKRLRQGAFNLTGKRFGRLRVLTYAGKRSNSLLWLCACNCGERCVVRTSQLLRGRSKSCGCAKLQTTHGYSSTRMYRAYCAMLTRCDNPNFAKYKYYGGRGITVCARWRGPHGFENYLADMGPRPRGKSIDRKDANGNYEPGNCRWATKLTQARNKRPRKSKPVQDMAAEMVEITGVQEPF